MFRIIPKLILLFVLLSSVNVFSKNVSGLIIDELTKQPIPYVNICVENQNRGTSSALDGSFTLKFRKAIDAKTYIIISSVGYETKKVLVSSITDSKQVILLIPKISTLSEVKIIPNKGKPIVIDKIKKSIIESTPISDLFINRAIF